MIIVHVMQNMNINEEGIDTTAIIIIIWSVYDTKILILFPAGLLYVLNGLRPKNYSKKNECLMLKTCQFQLIMGLFGGENT